MLRDFPKKTVGTGIFTYMHGWILWVFMQVKIPVPWILWSYGIVWAGVAQGPPFLMLFCFGSHLMISKNNIVMTGQPTLQ